MKKTLTMLAVLTLSTYSALSYTNPIENQTSEIIDHSSWILPPSNTLFIGGSTWGNSMIVTNAGYVENGSGYIGAEAGADSNSVIVTGTGSTWNNTINHLIVGSDGGSHNTLQVLDGGTIYNHMGVIGAQTGSGINSSSNNAALISGSGSTWHNAHYLYIGSFGSANSMEISDGAHVYSLAGYLGWETGADYNSVSISGTGSVWSNQHHTHVGSKGSGNTLQVQDGGSLYNQAAAIGAFSESENNLVQISGTGSVWQCSGDIYVGLSGSSNNLTISDGATVDNYFSRIGHEPEADGNSVLVTGNGSAFTNQVLLIIGNDGADNHLTVSDGGKVLSLLYGATIGEGTGSSNNSVIVTGTGSIWDNNDNISIGGSGSGNSLSILNGAHVENFIATVGNEVGSDHNTALISGTGSTWSNGAYITVGEYGSDNRLTITDGARVVSILYGASIGDRPGSARNTIEVTGTDSTLLCEDNVYVGENGTENTFTITDGGTVIDHIGSVGTQPEADRNTALISGSGSIWSNRVNNDIGDEGSYNTMIITNAGSVFAQYASIGKTTNSTFNTALVSGIGSGWINNTMVVGIEGFNNQLIINDGGHVETLYYAAIGYETNANNNSVLVTGIASLWNCGDLVAIGGYGSSNTMMVTEGGDVYCEEGSVGYYSSSSGNSVLVTGTGSSWLCSGILSIGGHYEAPGATGNIATVGSGATVETPLLIVYPGNTFQVASGGLLKVRNIEGDLILDGTLEQSRAQCHIDGSLTMGSSGKISMDYMLLADEPPPLKLTISGHASLNGTFELKANSGSVAWRLATLDVLDYMGGVSGQFHSANLPHLSFGRVWNTEKLNTTGELIIEPDPRDTNGNGIADGWELQYFGGPVSPTNNSDSDPSSNYEEYIAGTDPTNSASYFAFTNTIPTPSGFVIQWAPSISNRLYNVNWSTNIMTGLQPLAAGIEYPQNSFTDTVNGVENQSFYNVEVQMK